MMTAEFLQKRLHEVAGELKQLLAKPVWTAQQRARVIRLEFEIREIRELQVDRSGRNGWAEKYANAFRAWLRQGWFEKMYQRGITQEQRAILGERRDGLGTGGAAAYPSSTAGFFVPAEFEAQVTSALKFYGAMLEVCTLFDTASGAPRGYPMDNDTSVSGEQVDESAEVTAQDLSLSQKILKSYKFSSKLVLVSSELVQDTGFDLEAYLADRFGIRLARAMNPKFTTGSGTGEPSGVVTKASLGAIAAGAISNDGASGANTIGSDDVCALEGSVDVAYRRNAAYMLHPNTILALKKVKNKQGHPIFFQESPLLNNYPVIPNPHMDQLQTSASSPTVTRKTVLFGDFTKYVIRRAPLMVLRLEERFAEFGQVGFLAFQRADGDLIDGGGGAIKYLQNVY